MFIVTLPTVYDLELIERMFANPSVDGARFNVAVRSLKSPMETLEKVKAIADKYDKKLWIDLKGRQLRIVKWADPVFSEIELSHDLKVDLPAKIFFRGNDWSRIVDYEGNKVVVDPAPKYAVGAGQAVNVLGDDLVIKGDYLTQKDKDYITAAKQLGLHDYMLSFVEQDQDISDVVALDPDAKLVLKIESQKGLGYVSHSYTPDKGCLMAARDDLMLNIGDRKTDMFGALETMLEKDPDAIVASHLLTSLDDLGYLSHADLSDLRLLDMMGFKNYMLSDGVSQKCFDKAVKVWDEYRDVYHGK